MPAPPFERVDIGQLVAAIDRAWDMRDAIRATMGAHRPALRERARQTNTYLVRLLQERLPERMAALLPRTQGSSTDRTMRPSR